MSAKQTHGVRASLALNDKLTSVENGDAPQVTTAPTSMGVDLISSSGLYVGSSRSELASLLFAMSVDLEAVLERKKKIFRSEISSFIAEIEDRRRNTSFQARSVSIPVSEDERVHGLYNFVLGFFGYERRVRRTRYVLTQQLHTRDVAEKIDKFVAEARALFEEKFDSVVDVESTLKECMRLASNRLGHEEQTILRAVIRRSFSRISTTPWEVRFESEGPGALFREKDDICAATENAKRDFDRICNALIAEAQAARTIFEGDIERILAGVKEELIIAVMDRDQMEQVLNRAMVQELQLKLTHLRGPLHADGRLKLLSHVDGDFRRLLLRSQIP